MNNFMALLSRDKPSIMLGLGIGSMLSATVAAWIFSPMAAEAVKEKKEELDVDKLPPMEAIKTVAPYALPVVAFAGVGVGCTLNANQLNLERQAAAMAACALSETTSQVYREKVREAVGEKKEKAIREETAKAISEKNPVSTGGIILTGNGDCLCYDDATKQHFRSNQTVIQDTINRLNYEMMSNKSIITLDDYCLMLGLEPVLLGQELAWSVDTTGIINPDYTATLKNGEPCLVISHFYHPPKPFR